jgi:hypothetical protein
MSNRLSKVIRGLWPNDSASSCKEVWCHDSKGISGYFDDAGNIHDLPSMVIGGFIGRKEQWEILWSARERLLSKHEPDTAMASIASMATKSSTN